MSLFTLCEKLKEAEPNFFFFNFGDWIGSEMEKSADAADASVLFFPWLCLFIGCIHAANYATCNVL